MAQRLVNNEEASPVLHWVSRIHRAVSRNGMNCARVLRTAVLRADARCQPHISIVHPRHGVGECDNDRVPVAGNV